MPSFTITNTTSGADLGVYEGATAADAWAALMADVGGDFQEPGADIQITLNDQQWFAFKAFNSQTRYAFGSAAEADRYEDILNAGRENNHFQAIALLPAEVLDLRLEEGHSDGFNLDNEITAHEEAAQ